MKKNLFFILSMLAGLSHIAHSQTIEQKLTNGQKKRWLFSNSQLTMGSRVKTMSDCKFSAITFDFVSKKYFGVSCNDNKTQNGKFSIEKASLEEHYINLDGVKYEVLIYTEKINGKAKEILLLRIAGFQKTEETAEYFYHGE